MDEAISVTLNGVPVKIRDMRISETQNEKTRLTGTIRSEDGSLEVDIDDELIVSVGGERIFGGYIKVPTLDGFGDSSVRANRFSALDYHDNADRQTFTGVIPAGNVKAAATAMLPYLGGVTLYGSQPNGPSLDELTYTDTYIQDILKDIAVRSGWLYRIDYNKVLRYYAPGSIAETWNITEDTTSPDLVGNIAVTKNRINYANRIIVKFMAAARFAYAFLYATGNFNDGEEVEIGGRTYTFQATLTDSNGNVKIGSSISESLLSLASAITLGAGSGSTYAASTTLNTSVTAYPQTSTMLRVRAATAGSGGNSIGVSTTAADVDWVGEGFVPLSNLYLGFDEALADSAQVDDLTQQGLYGIYTKIVEAPNVYNATSARSLGEAILATAIVLQRTATYKSYRKVSAGRTQNVVRASRNLNADCLITKVDTQQIEGNLLQRTVSLLIGEAYRGDRWREWWKSRSGSGSGVSSFGGIVSGGGSGGGGRPVYFLGASATTWVQSPTPTWVPVDQAGAIYYAIDTTVRGNTTGTVTVRLRAQSGSVQARLWDVTNGTQVGISDVVSSTSYVTKSFAVSLTPGLAVYRLELLPGTANVDVNGVGYFE